MKYQLGLNKYALLFLLIWSFTNSDAQLSVTDVQGGMIGSSAYFGGQNNLLKVNGYADFISPELGVNQPLKNLFGQPISLAQYYSSELGPNASKSVAWHAPVSVSFIQKSAEFLPKNWGWSLGLRRTNVGQAEITNSLIEMAYLGNVKTAGDTVNLGNNYINQLSFNSFDIGVIKEFTLFEKPAFWQYGISLNQGSKLNNLALNNAKIYTDEYGEFIDVKYELTALNNTSALNGFGFGLNGSLTLQPTENSILSISAQNFGYLFWGNGLEQVSGKVDTEVHGFYLPFSELENFNDHSVSNHLDSLQNLVTPDTVSGSARTTIPPFISLNYVTKTSEQFSVFVQLEALPTLSAYPSIIGGATYNKGVLLAGAFAGLSKSGDFTSGVRLGFKANSMFSLLQFNGIETIVGSTGNAAISLNAGFLF
ncbi:MAG: hypothetical protein KDC92_07605 [Bacteroidetes bacterium]|nr:hypothetical protein [Bacteroidota bacterium]